MVAGGTAVVVIVYCAYEIVTYRPCHPSGPLTEIGEDIADYFIPLDEEEEEEFEYDPDRYAECLEIYEFRKNLCDQHQYTPGGLQECLDAAEADFDQCAKEAGM